MTEHGTNGDRKEGENTVINALTIDVEDYFQVSNFEPYVRFEDWGDYEVRVVANTRRLLSLLRRYGVKATFFLLGWVAERFPELVWEIHTEGHEVACHGYAHRMIQPESRESFRQDIRKAKKIIESIIGQPVVGYRAPSFSITRDTFWAFSILKEEGFCYDSSIFPVRHDRYGIPDFHRFPCVVNSDDSGGILEFPLSTVQLFDRNIPIAGGGYMRFFPYWFIRQGIHRVNRKEGQPVIAYVNAWELDPEQPRISEVPVPASWRHYHNIKDTEGKIVRLLSDFSFSTVKNALSAVVRNPAYRHLCE